ncbi:MAG: sce7725 family protein [Candidatus Marinimicrobia bacterium]|nr:sce7725 family protein [Candidatus Neomarinimicrobiota bacterium]
MYYPFLRGKLYELLALRELSDKEDLGSIIPIIEPVQDNYSAINKATEKLIANDNQHIFIYKPNVGELGIKKDFDKLIGNIHRAENQIPGFILDGKSDQVVTDLVRQINPEKIALIHYEKAPSIDDFMRGFGRDNIINILHLDRLGPFIRRNYPDFKNIMLRDPFTSEQRNADYENVDSQSLSDDHRFYKEEGYAGYSDYLVIGEEFSSTGFAPYAVAIHLTFFKEDDSCWVKHFVSDSNQDQSDIGGKYMEAMEKLIGWADENSQLITPTSAFEELRDLYNQEHYPGLGYLKKLSIKHHIEMINSYFLNN